MLTITRRNNGKQSDISSVLENALRIIREKGFGVGIFGDVFVANEIRLNDSHRNLFDRRYATAGELLTDVMVDASLLMTRILLKFSAKFAQPT